MGMKKLLLIMLCSCCIFLFANAGNITAAEYFIDSDPGIGNGTALNVGVSGTIVNFVAAVPTASLSAGFHFVAIRTKDASGKWGLFENRGFYLSGQTTNVANIIAAEYYYDTDPGVGNGTAIPIPAPISNYTDSLILPLGSLPIGNHRIAIRVKNADGHWGLLENKLFNICTRNGPLSKMNFHIENNQAFFTNLSTDNDTTLWKFGDATTDTVLNPIKTYAAAGNYNLQLISKNICANDTLLKVIPITGIHRINANKGGNNGVATVIFDGNGFTPTTPLKLERSGVILLPSDKLFISTNRIIGYFNLTGADTGRYNVIANLGGGPLDTLKNGFTISPALPALVSMVKGGRNPARTGFMLRQMRLQNRGNEDAIMLPFATLVGYRPGTITLASLESFVDLANKGVFQNTLNYLSANSISPDVLNAIDIDTTRKKQLLAYYRVKVPAESYVTNYYRINNPSGLLSYENSSLVHPPLFKSTIVLNDIAAPNARDCMNSFLKKAVKKNINVSISDVAWNSCFNTAFDTLAKSVRDIVKDISQQNKSIPMKSMFATLLVQMSQCAASGMPASLTSTQFEKIIKDVTFNWLYLENIDSIGRPCIDTTETLVFRQQAHNNKGVNEIKALSQRTEDDDCPGGAFFPELYELCQPFLEVCGKVDELGDADEKIFKLFGKKIFDKFLGPFENACKVNSANAFCEKLCEQTSVDPNVKYGPGDNTNLKHVNFLHNYGYTIFFENLASATAPAAYVEITDTLDMTWLDISTFQTSGFGWGDSVAFTDANRSDYSLLKDLQPGKPNKLRVDVRIDTITGIVKWKFFTLDPVTLQLTDDPTEGFLPPNINGTEGVGYVSFSIKAKANAGITSGSVINNSASIVFDQNAPILTPVWQHIVDTTKPQSQVIALPAIVSTPNFVVNWGGSDAHAGIDKFAVYVSVNDSLFKHWKKFTTAVTDTFHGQFNKTYKFFSIAVDKAGNFEEAPFDPYLTPDAVTSVQIALPVSLLSFDARKTSDGKKAELLWVTTFEQNVSRFEIQRSAEGINYTTIGVVNALNAINGSNYSWQDISPLSNLNFYRLRMVDIDASSKISPVRILRFGEKDDLLVFPTLTSNLVFIQSPKEVTAQLINMLGEVLQQKVVKGSASFDVSGLPSGTYIIKIEGEKKVFKILKQ
jgi:PKD repeat protein